MVITSMKTNNTKLESLGAGHGRGVERRGDYFLQGDPGRSCWSEQKRVQEQLCSLREVQQARRS